MSRTLFSVGSAMTIKFESANFIVETFYFRVVKTVFLENGVFVPYRKQVVLTKNGENDDLHSTHKNKGCAPQSPETDENDENGGCPSDKTGVYQKQGFRHPDYCLRRLLVPSLSLKNSQKR